MRDWKGWENSGPMKSVDAVVKEHRLFIVLVVFKKSQVIKRKTHKIHAWYIYYSATFYLLTISLRDLNVLKKVGIIPIYLTNNCQQHIYIKS